MVITLRNTTFVFDGVGESSEMRSMDDRKNLSITDYLETLKKSVQYISYISAIKREIKESGIGLEPVIVEASGRYSLRFIDSFGLLYSFTLEGGNGRILFSGDSKKYEIRKIRNAKEFYSQLQETMLPQIDMYSTPLEGIDLAVNRLLSRHITPENKRGHPIIDLYH